MFVLGVDGIPNGWVGFKVDVSTLSSSVETFSDLQCIFQTKPEAYSYICIDIPIGLLNGARACDAAARKLLGQTRGASVFAAPCRASLSHRKHVDASAANMRFTGKGLSIQAWCISPKIKQVDDAITAASQEWVFEVHPEVCFWALNNKAPMRHNKKSREGLTERSILLRTAFPAIELHLSSRPPGVGRDDLLDAAAAAWTALRIQRGEAQQVCEPERDERGLAVTMWY